MPLILFNQRTDSLCSPSFRKEIKVFKGHLTSLCDCLGRPDAVRVNRTGHWFPVRPQDAHGPSCAFLNESDCAPVYPASPPQAPTALAPLHGHSQVPARGRQQQWALLRHRPPLHHAAVRHPLHRPLQVADEQSAGLHHVRSLLCVPGGQRPPGRQNPRVPCLHLAGKAIS